MSPRALFIPSSGEDLMSQEACPDMVGIPPRLPAVAAILSAGGIGRFVGSLPPLPYCAAAGRYFLLWDIAPSRTDRQGTRPAVNSADRKIPLLKAAQAAFRCGKFMCRRADPPYCIAGSQAGKCRRRVLFCVR